MMWVYKQSTGEIFLRGSPVTTPVGKGYSGAGTGKNNPDYQCVQDIGPIPRGQYDIGGETNNPSPVTLPLHPDSNNDMCGRSGFLIHGDNVERPGWASSGCIILNRDVREKIRDSGINRLEVIA